jgi:superfamily II DNA/RNA helicase
MFSATFPRAVETLARQILNNPVEIQVRRQLRGWHAWLPVGRSKNASFSDCVMCLNSTT